MSSLAQKEFEVDVFKIGQTNAERTFAIKDEGIRINAGDLTTLPKGSGCDN